MEEIIVMKGPGNVLVPATQEDAEKIAKYKMGNGIRVKTTRMSDNNLKFHRKLHVLATYLFDIFCDRVDTGIQYRGQLVKPSYDRFRKDMTILAGHYDATYKIDGTVRVEAKSWAFSNMDDAEKERVYSDLINVALKHLSQYGQNMSHDQLQGIIDSLMQFDK